MENCLQARIKKIMQADEDVGKIAMAVPVLVCELLVFLVLVLDIRLSVFLTLFLYLCSQSIGIVLARSL